MFRIRFGFKADPDPAFLFKANTDSDLNPVTRFIKNKVVKKYGEHFCQYLQKPAKIARIFHYLGVVLLSWTRIQEKKVDADPDP